jgi:hypothetical protein
MGQDESSSKFNCRLGGTDPQDTLYETDKPNAHLRDYSEEQSEYNSKANRKSNRRLQAKNKPMYSIFQKNQSDSGESSVFNRV